MPGGVYPNRTVCDVLEEMRKCNETRNYAYLHALIEELQSLANRMEAALYDVKDVNYLRDQKRKLKREVRKLESKLESLKESDD